MSSPSPPASPSSLLGSLWLESTTGVVALVVDLDSAPGDCVRVLSPREGLETYPLFSLTRLSRVDSPSSPPCVSLSSFLFVSARDVLAIRR